MTSMSDGGAPGRPAGLRERKKARTRAAIREQALRLFREQGYPGTTVEQIAAAAEVSPATFFRYFPTKEEVVLQDDMDVITVEAFEAQPPGLSPVAAMRAAVAAIFAELTPDELDRLRETTEMTLSVPEIRARAVDELTRSIEVIAGAVARRTGRTAADFAVRNLAGAMIGVILAATLPARAEAPAIRAEAPAIRAEAPAARAEAPAAPAEAVAADDQGADMFERIDAALAHLEAGLPL